MSQWLSRSSVGPSCAHDHTDGVADIVALNNVSKPTARISARIRSTTALSSPGGLGQRMRD